MGAEVLYRVPWADGLSYMFTQVPGGRITSHFTKATLFAVDVAMPEGVPIVAARAGVVEATQARHGDGQEAPTYEGNFVRVRHADGTAATYAHLRHGGVAVAAGERVDAGQLLGFSGASGDVTAPHLHFVVTRKERNSAGWEEEISVPITFYVGAPPVAFAPRPALSVNADYSHPVAAPRTPSETPLFPRAIRVLQPGEEAAAWGAAALWLLCGIAAFAWFWMLTRRLA